MQKVYLLLRNNQQTGPYSFEDLLALHLKPKDLVWVEGKSHGWRYPNEIEALKPYIAGPELSQKVEPPPSIIDENPRQVSQARPTAYAPKKIFVSMPVTGEVRSLSREPVDPIEQKAEELRKRVQEYTPQEQVNTNYNRDLHNAEEEYTKWIYEKKIKKKKLFNKKTIAIAAVSILLLSGGWWASTKFINPSSVSSPIVQQSQEQQVPVLNSEIAPEMQEQPTSPAENNISSTPAVALKKEEIKKQEQGKKVPVAEKKIAIEEKKTTPEAIENTVEPIEKNTGYNTPAKEEEEKEVLARSPVEKKKTVKERINELFKNKKTKQPAGSAEQTPNDSNPGERTASRRNEDKEMAPVVTDVSDQVEIKTNKIADSWMMGVKNLKLTLVNRSNLTISAAKLEVLYYSEQDNLLDKKILSFSNIPPGKSQTVAAPDQRMADHIEHKVISASGIDNAYAQQ